MAGKKSPKKGTVKLKMTLSQQVAASRRILELIQSGESVAATWRSMAAEIAKSSKFPSVLVDLPQVTASFGFEQDGIRADGDIRDSVLESRSCRLESGLSEGDEPSLAIWKDAGFESVACFPLTGPGGISRGTLTLCHTARIDMDKSLQDWLARTTLLLGMYSLGPGEAQSDESLPEAKQTISHLQSQIDLERRAKEKAESEVGRIRQELELFRQKSEEQLAEAERRGTEGKEEDVERKLKEQKSRLTREFRKTVEKAVMTLRQNKSVLADYSEKNRKLRQEAASLREGQSKTLSGFHSILAEALKHTDSNKFYPELHRHISHLIPAQDFYFALYEGDALSFPYFSSSTKKSSEVAEEDKGFIDYVVRTGEPLLTSTDEIALFDSRDAVSCNWLGVPVTPFGRPRGILVVQGSGVKYGEQEKMLLHFVALLLSIVLEKNHSLEIQHSMSVWDELTLLPNHRLYPLLVSQHFGHARRHKEMTASMLLELEMWQQTGETPASIPEIVLKQAADRMLKRMREGDVMVRFGPTRFLWSFGGLHRIEDVVLVAEKVLGNLSAPFIVEGQPHKLSGRIGISIFPNDGQEPDILMSKAEVALEKSKTTPPNCFRFYDREMNEQAARAKQKTEQTADLQKPLIAEKSQTAAQQKSAIPQATQQEPAPKKPLTLKAPQEPLKLQTEKTKQDAELPPKAAPVGKKQSDETQPLTPFIQKSQSYAVTCPGCHSQFDALRASWCRCLTDEPTLVCSKCNSCFCNTSVNFKHRVWETAPDSLWEKRRRLQAEHSTIPVNPGLSQVKPPVVLVVDDEHPVLVSAWKVIRSMGYSVILARNGEEGLELAKEYAPGLVLSDALMPRMDGRELCRILKADPQTAGIKTVIMTAFTGAGKYKTGVMKEFHFDEHLQKPIDYEKLRSVLNKFLPLS